MVVVVYFIFFKMWASTLVDSESGGEVMDKEYGGLCNMGVVVVGVVVVTHILTPHGHSCDQIPRTQEPPYNSHQWLVYLQLLYYIILFFKCFGLKNSPPQLDDTLYKYPTLKRRKGGVSFDTKYFVSFVFLVVVVILFYVCFFSPSVGSTLVKIMLSLTWKFTFDMQSGEPYNTSRYFTPIQSCIRLASCWHHGQE